MDIDKNPVDFTQFKDKVVLVVNVASNCGYTKIHYEQLPFLYKKYNSRGLEIVAFPCNQFGLQEPGDNEQIKQVAESYGLNFRLMDKIEVNGENAHPLWEYLKGQTGGSDVKWNFSKFLINKKGQVYGKYPSEISPLQIEEQIILLLKEP
uniref:Glutathione peroxidase n=1 Tax=Arcella intermedia TaxID=1963864 RepID=A0A6B2LMJ7_9EUKA